MPYSTGIMFQKVGISIQGKENVLRVSLSCRKRMEYSHISLPLCLFALCFMISFTFHLGLQYIYLCISLINAPAIAVSSTALKTSDIQTLHC